MHSSAATRPETEQPTPITKHATSYKKPLYSQWFVETREEPRAWYDRLKPVIDAGDNRFVCRVQVPWIGWFGKSNKDIGERLRAPGRTGLRLGARLQRRRQRL